MKRLAILLLFLTSCASVKPTYDYQAEGKKGVHYKKAHKQKNNYVKFITVLVFTGIFIVEKYD